MMLISLKFQYPAVELVCRLLPRRYMLPAFLTASHSTPDSSPYTSRDTPSTTRFFGNTTLPCVPTTMFTTYSRYEVG